MSRKSCQIVLECKNCRKRFSVPPSRSSAQFCSKPCKGEWMSGPNSPTWNGGSVERLCEMCGTAFSVIPSLVDHETKGRFCSLKCVHAQNSRRTRGVSRTAVEGSCSVCGKAMRVPPARAEKMRFCSNKCRNRGMSGENSPAWKGGISKHPDAAKRYHERRRARLAGVAGDISLQEWDAMKAHYGYRCLRCGRKEPEIALTMDHVIPLSKGGRNEISNIQPLCSSCNSRKWARHIDYRPQPYDVPTPAREEVPANVIEETGELLF